MNGLSAVEMKHRVEKLGFPFGWYGVAEASDVHPGMVLPLRWLNREWIVYRTAHGVAQVADAFCPHLGAHLASGDGSTCEGRIVCPFHKWQFDGATGELVSIPYSETKLSSKVQLTLLPTREVDGVILVWYHPLGREPQFEPFTNFGAGQAQDWNLHTLKRWETTCPYRDILENLFDTAHIVQLHNAEAQPVIQAYEKTSYGLRVQYESRSKPGQAALLKSFECNLSGVTLLSQRFEGVGYAALFILSFTPIDDERFVQTARLYLKNDGPAEMSAIVGKTFMDRFIYEVEQDLKVLNYKKHLSSPMLCADDGPIMKFRTYANGYYL